MRLVEEPWDTEDRATRYVSYLPGHSSPGGADPRRVERSVRGGERRRAHGSSLMTARGMTDNATFSAGGRGRAGRPDSRAPTATEPWQRQRHPPAMLRRDVLL